MDFHVLLDSPDAPASRLQIAKVGDYKDPRYGDFSITEADTQEWAKNLSLLPGGKALIDLDHSADKGGPTEAAGWITDITLEDGVPMAEVEWTPVGESAIRERRYQFFSPAFGKHSVEGKSYNNVLSGGALTNKPFLNMATVTLASEDRVKRALLAELPLEDIDKLLLAAVGSVQDSPHPMPLPANIAEALGVAEDADEQIALDAITALKDKAETPPAEPEKITLAQAEKIVADSGKVLLDSAKVAELELGAAQGAEAKKLLDTQTFDHAFNEAQREGRAVPADEDFYRELPLDTAVKRLSEAPKIVNVRAVGSSTTAAADEAPEGVHEGSYLLDQQVRKKLLETNRGMEHYMDALTEVRNEITVEA